MRLQNPPIQFVYPLEERNCGIESLLVFRCGERPSLCRPRWQRQHLPEARDIFNPGGRPPDRHWLPGALAIYRPGP
jgi:hypothetical protein